jgi:hypothetical protein
MGDLGAVETGWGQGAGYSWEEHISDSPTITIDGTVSQRHAIQFKSLMHVSQFQMDHCSCLIAAAHRPGDGDAVWTLAAIRALQSAATPTLHVPTRARQRDQRHHGRLKPIVSKRQLAC